MINYNHHPALLNEIKDFFKTEKKGIIVDATLGLGGHSYALLEQNKNINIIGIDRDNEAIEIAKNRLHQFENRIEIINDKFSNAIIEIIKKHNNILGILADIGISSYQIDNIDRGFSFHSNKLDMRMDKNNLLNAKYIVNKYTKEELNRIFKNYGEIKSYELVTKKIIDYRKQKNIESSKELSSIFETSKPCRIHPATLVFQAIRIEVNNELYEIETLLDNIKTIKKAKVAIISFHSLEDRIIKDKFKQFAKNCICRNDVMRCQCGANHSKGVILTKKPITPRIDEIKINNKVRSAKMRCFKFND